MTDDTDPTIERMRIEGFRRMTTAARLRRVGELNRTLDLLASADVRRRYPAADEREVRLRVASRRVPAELMRAAFGWDVDKEGY